MMGEMEEVKNRGISLEKEVKELKTIIKRQQAEQFSSDNVGLGTKHSKEQGSDIMNKWTSGTDSEEWDARSESTRESLPTDPSGISLRKIPKQLVQVKEMRCAQLKQSVHNYRVENAKLKAENAALQSRIEFHRDCLLRSRSSSSSKGMPVSVAVVTFLACVLTGDFGSEDTAGSGRKLLQWGVDSNLTARLVVAAILALATYLLVDAFMPKSSPKPQ